MQYIPTRRENRKSSNIFDISLRCAVNNVVVVVIAYSLLPFAIISVVVVGLTMLSQPVQTKRRVFDANTKRLQVACGCYC